MRVPSPITAMNWFRVCLDEAQLVEQGTTKAAEIACNITTVHRWCVSGTPCSRGLDDLAGLMMFMKVDPIGDLR